MQEIQTRGRGAIDHTHALHTAWCRSSAVAEAEPTSDGAAPKIEQWEGRNAIALPEQQVRAINARVLRDAPELVVHEMQELNEMEKQNEIDKQNKIGREAANVDAATEKAMGPPKNNDV